MLRPALVTVLAALCLTAAGCNGNSLTETPSTASVSDGPSPTPPDTPTPVTPTPSETTASETTPPETTPPSTSEEVVVDYGTAGVFVETSDDVDVLAGAPADFAAFVGTLADKAQQAGASCPDAAHGITVLRIRHDFALGAVNDCGGYTALWSRVDGQWREILGTQEPWSCQDLAEHDVPQGFAGSCVE